MIITFIIIFCFIALTCSVLFLLYRTDSTKLKDLLISYLITVSGTGIGVYAAVAVNDYYTANQEKHQLEMVLFQAENEVSNTINKGPHAIGNVLNMRAPIAKVASLEALVINPLIAKHAPTLSVYLLKIHGDIELIFQNLSSSNLNEVIKVTYIKDYIKALERTNDLLALGVRFLSGDIDDAEFQSELNKIEKQ